MPLSLRCSSLILLRNRRNLTGTCALLAGVETCLFPKGLTLSLAHTSNAMIRMDELLASRISKTGISLFPRIFAKVSMEARNTELQAYEARPNIVLSGL